MIGDPVLYVPAALYKVGEQKDSAISGATHVGRHRVGGCRIAIQVVRNDGHEAIGGIVIGEKLQEVSQLDRFSQAWAS